MAKYKKQEDTIYQVTAFDGKYISDESSLKEAKEKAKEWTERTGRPAQIRKKIGFTEPEKPSRKKRGRKPNQEGFLGGRTW